eukprot:CAMPEP_0194300820 /NCGR_PEP_ID=MMETSP0169-20130528/61467_1 /TAXON_ID=218684 /ORGANISM="Corethron pennatum, Strain L29A3" /LENGTH=257 /DNA_ID=CAMNT_0039051029 /DNA_START=572 /DNA_END=1345 /DNA_ORIENTATION=-
MSLSLILSSALLFGAADAFVTRPSIAHAERQRHAFLNLPNAGRYASSILMASTVEGRTIVGTATPMSNFVLIRVDKTPEQTEGGIILSKSAKKKATTGTVISIGPGETHQDTGVVIPMPVAAGDKVQYGEYDGTEIDIDGEKHTLIRNSDVLVKYSGESPTLADVQVTGDSLLVLPREEEETTGGLLIAATSRKANKPSTGTVVKVGPGKTAGTGEFLPIDVAEGDMVKYRDFAGTDINIEGQDYAVVKYTDCLAKF